MFKRHKLDLLKVGIGFLLTFSCSNVHAIVQISGLDDITINAWAGVSSDLQGTDTYCVLSCAGGGCNPNNFGDRQNYDVAADTLGTTDGAGNFYLENGSGDLLLVTYEWTHPTGGTYQMSDYGTTGFLAGPVQGAVSCATDPNSQVSITITVSAADLAAAPAGTYAETFEIDACRVNNAGDCQTNGGNLQTQDFIVTLPELIQITSLDNINLGIWGGGNIQVSENFCIFRNSFGGLAITTNGANDAGGNFNLAQGVNTIPYQLEFRQGGGYFNATPSGRLDNATTGFTGDSTRDCGNGVNTEARITILAADITGNPGGNYSDTLTLLVEPD